MNKIIVEQDELDLQDKKIKLEILTNHTTLNIFNENYLKIDNLPNQTNLTINLQNNSFLTIDLALSLSNHEINIILNNGCNSTLNLNMATTFTGINNLTINSEISKDNSFTNIRFHGVSENGSLNILATGKIFKNTQHNKYLEDISIITDDYNCVKIMPDLIIDSDSVEANHKATIAPVNEEELFYLKSKGLTKEKAITLIKSGFLNSIIRKIDE